MVRFGFFVLFRHDTKDEATMPKTTTLPVTKVKPTLSFLGVWMLQVVDPYAAVRHDLFVGVVRHHFHTVL
jgi:hypothetical protein